MRGRLKSELLDRVLSYGDRALALADRLEDARRSRRVVDQLTGSGTAVGANLYEAHEALSTRDFLKCVGQATKELSETKFWLLLIVKRGYVTQRRLQPLLDETEELLTILKSITGRTRRKLKRL